MDEHISGRCDLLPEIVGVDNPISESGFDWFARQDEAVQRDIMGPGRFDAYRSGAASWQDMAVHTHDATWGGSLHPAPVSSLGARVAA
jgi:hypothetical protein